MSNLAVFVPVLLLATFVTDAEPKLMCWKCSSNDTYMCKDLFLNGEPYSDHLEMMDTCGAAPEASMKAVCIKEKKYVAGEQVTTRGCSYKTEDQMYTYECPEDEEDPESEKGFCETCNYAGCNGAATIGTTIALLLATSGLLLFK